MQEQRHILFYIGVLYLIFEVISISVMLYYRKSSIQKNSTIKFTIMFGLSVNIKRFYL
jgi:uncharacterized protein YpmB